MATVLSELAAVARAEKASWPGWHEVMGSSSRRFLESLSPPDAARGVCSRVPSGLRTTNASPTGLMRWRPSCSRMWWRWHSSARLSALVSPPSAQCLMWWASQRDGGASQPGHTQPPSRAMRTQRSASLTRRVRRPTSMTRPLLLSTVGMISASQAMRRTVAAERLSPLSVMPARWSPSSRASRLVLTRSTGRTRLPSSSESAHPPSSRLLPSRAPSPGSLPSRSLLSASAVARSLASVALVSTSTASSWPVTPVVWPRSSSHSVVPASALREGSVPPEFGRSGPSVRDPPPFEFWPRDPDIAATDRSCWRSRRRSPGVWKTGPEGPSALDALPPGLGRDDWDVAAHRASMSRCSGLRRCLGGCCLSVRHIRLAIAATLALSRAPPSGSSAPSRHTIPAPLL